MEAGDAAANGSGYESDNEDNDEDAPGPRHNAPEPATAAALALAASPDGSALPSLALNCQLLDTYVLKCGPLTSSAPA